jgi:hypothetical protein
MLHRPQLFSPETELLRQLRKKLMRDGVNEDVTLKNHLCAHDSTHWMVRVSISLFDFWTTNAL